MANIKLIKRRIQSAENISQITKAMEMVAASKMKKAQNTALNGKPYADKIDQAIKLLAHKVDRSQHPLLKQGKTGGSKLLIVISTNKGLCGGLNTNLFRFIISNFKDYPNVEVITVGKKGKQFIVRWGRKLIADFSENLPFSVNVPALIQMVVDGFVSGQFSNVIVVYNNFLTALEQEPLAKSILPIGEIPQATAEDIKNFADLLLEPNAPEILNSLLPHYLENQLRTAIYEAEASEHSARMIAMKNATDAADDLIDGLTLLYNKARQEKITYEIADMVTARLSVK